MSCLLLGPGTKIYLELTMLEGKALTILWGYFSPLAYEPLWRKLDQPDAQDSTIAQRGLSSRTACARWAPPSSSLWWQEE
jgi:hypothetical protein